MKIVMSTGGGFGLPQRIRQRRYELWLSYGGPGPRDPGPHYVK